jgi:hypothetical protein
VPKRNDGMRPVSENFWLRKFRTTFATWSLWAWRESIMCYVRRFSLNQAGVEF